MIRIVLIKFSLLGLFLISGNFSFGQTTNVRGMYVTDIHNWLGNVIKENELLDYAQGNGYTYMTFYDLGSLSWSNASMKNSLAAFIKKAKTQYGLSQIGACGENAAFFSNNIIPYNNSRSLASEKFDVLNLEFEFWVNSSISSQYCNRYLRPNGYSCDTAGAFKFAKLEYRNIDALANANGLISEMYLGWPNKGQMQDVAYNLDRILLHAYRPDDSDVYQYSRNRLIDIASTGNQVEVIPLFSAEPNYMGPWLNSNPITKPYQTYQTKYFVESGNWKSNINLQGYHWFTYKHLPKTIMATANVSADGPTIFCTGGSVTLTANSGSSYLWTPGGQTTKSIIATQTGSYKVTVMNSSGATATSSEIDVIVGNTTVAPTISANGPTTFCSSSDVTLSSSPADTYLWSNGATTQSITVNQSGNYTVTISSNNCVATSSAKMVSATPIPTVPTVTSNGSTTLCSGSSVTLSSSNASGYLWSTGSSNQSINVGTPGTYWVRVYNAAGCYNQSADITIATASAPANPVVTASGPTDLCPGESVTLSTNFNPLGYVWSTGDTTQSILVQNPGIYWVKVYNSSNCVAQSAITVVTVVNPNNPPVISANGSLNLCSGNSVTLSATAAGTYLWSNGATTQSINVSTAGTYQVTTGAGNCTAQSAPVSVTTNGAPVPVISSVGPASFCPGASVTLTSSSANNYLWSTGATTQSISVSSSGSYWVRGYVSGNCYAQSANFSVQTLAPPAVPIITPDGPTDLSPGNPSVTLSSSPGNSYYWTNGQTTQSITVNQAGTYAVTVTGSNGCTATSDPTVVTTLSCTPPPVPLISLSGPTTISPGQILTLTSTYANGYLWSTGETTRSIDVSSAGVYDVQVYDIPGCFSTSLAVTVVESTTGISLLQKSVQGNSIFAYPNPATETVSIRHSSDILEDAVLTLMDITSREVYRREFVRHNGENVYEIQVSDLPRGVYIINFFSHNMNHSARLVLN